MRYIITLKYYFSLLGNSISEFREDIYHMFSCEGAILQGLHLSLVGIFTDLIHREVEKRLLPSYLWILDDYLAFTQKLYECLVSNRVS